MNLTNYSVSAGAGAGLDYVPPIFTNGGTSSHARCIIVVRKHGNILSLRPKSVELPEVTIETNQSIRTATQAAMRSRFGFAAGGLELHGRFLPNNKLPPVFLLRYLPLKEEVKALEGKKGLAWFSEVGLVLSKGSLPFELLRLMINLNPGGELGHDVCGKLCIWTSEVERRVLGESVTEEETQERLTA